MFRRASQSNQNGNVNFMLYPARIKNFKVFEIFRHFTNLFLEFGFLGEKNACVKPGSATGGVL